MSLIACSHRRSPPFSFSAAGLAGPAAAPLASQPATKPAGAESDGVAATDGVDYLQQPDCDGRSALNRPSCAAKDTSMTCPPDD